MLNPKQQESKKIYEKHTKKSVQKKNQRPKMLKKRRLECEEKQEKRKKCSKPVCIQHPFGSGVHKSIPAGGPAVPFGKDPTNRVTHVPLNCFETGLQVDCHQPFGSGPSQIGWGSPVLWLWLSVHQMFLTRGSAAGKKDDEFHPMFEMGPIDLSCGGASNCYFARTHPWLGRWATHGVVR